MISDRTALDYLDNLIASYREHTPVFSFRWLAERCGVKSPNYIQQVLIGKKGLSASLASRICAAVRASPEQRETLLLLHKRDQSTDARVRALIEVRLEAMSVEHSAQAIGPDDEVLFQSWFAPVIWAFANGRTQSEVTALFPQLCTNLVSTREVDRVLAGLMRSGLLVTSNTGLLAIRAEVLQGKTKFSPALVGAFYQSCAAISRRLIALQERVGTRAELGSLARVTTFSVDAAARERIGERVAAFHKELIAEFSLQGDDAKAPLAIAQIVTFEHMFRCADKGPAEAKD